MSRLKKIFENIQNISEQMDDESSMSFTDKPYQDKFSTSIAIPSYYASIKMNIKDESAYDYQTSPSLGIEITGRSPETGTKTQNVKMSLNVKQIDELIKNLSLAKKYL